MDDFIDLLLSFTSSDKIQLNVISIVSETMMNKAEEIVVAILDAQEKNSDVSIVIDQLSSRNKVYEALFSRHKGRRRAVRCETRHTRRENACKDASAILENKKKSAKLGHNVSDKKRSKTEYNRTTKKETGQINKFKKGSGIAIVSAKRVERQRYSEPKDEVVEKVSEKNTENTEDIENKLKKAKLLSTEAFSIKNVDIPAFTDAVSKTQNKSDNEASVKKGPVGICNAESSSVGGLLSTLESLTKNKLKNERCIKKINIKLLDEVLFKIIQCKVCGLRYSSNEKEELSLHLLDHQRKIRASEAKNIISRDYLCRRNEWLVSKLNLPSIKIVKKLIACDKPQTCKVCKNMICLTWCDEDEQWTLNDAVEVRGDQYCHRKCVE